jgi:hypothetical protein
MALTFARYKLALGSRGTYCRVVGRNFLMALADVDGGLVELSSLKRLVSFVGAGEGPGYPLVWTPPVTVTRYRQDPVPKPTRSGTGFALVATGLPSRSRSRHSRTSETVSEGGTEAVRSGDTVRAASSPCGVYATPYWRRSPGSPVARKSDVGACSGLASTALLACTRGERRAQSNHLLTSCGSIREGVGVWLRCSITSQQTPAYRS